MLFLLHAGDSARERPAESFSPPRAPPVLSRAPGKGRGYTYFGAAKKLPGVKELFDTEPVKVARRSRYQMHKAIDPDYYGFRCGQRGLHPRSLPCVLDHRITASQRGLRGQGPGCGQGPGAGARVGTVGFRPGAGRHLLRR